MILTTFGIMSFGLRWIVIDSLAEWTGFIKIKQPAVRRGFGSTYQAAASRHPEPRKSVNTKPALSIAKLSQYTGSNIDRRMQRNHGGELLKGPPK